MSTGKPQVLMYARGGCGYCSRARALFERKGVARFKTPERVEVVDAVPVLAAGKPDRLALKQRL